MLPISAAEIATVASRPERNALPGFSADVFLDVGHSDDFRKHTTRRDIERTSVTDDYRATLFRFSRVEQPDVLGYTKRKRSKP